MVKGRERTAAVVRRAGEYSPTDSIRGKEKKDIQKHPCILHCAVSRTQMTLPLENEMST
jgi:hypothetical protein